MATRNLRVRRLISPQWGQSDLPSTASAWAQPRPEDAPRFVAIRRFDWLRTGKAIASHPFFRSSAEHSRGREGVSTAACRSRTELNSEGLLLLIWEQFALIFITGLSAECVRLLSAPSEPLFASLDFK
ncbi:hypothetical protein G5714_005720 [Onychostoma macrolepis]|uniref:Uncharacterized protein n=1 Tax=Onychostoma macrolepis TaxID=369639 RepID=A0A7J6D1U3_9TELE|nr:hypothetical protein G5714_005720 [Onychostoma macrolepis]